MASPAAPSPFARPSPAGMGPATAHTPSSFRPGLPAQGSSAAPTPGAGASPSAFTRPGAHTVGSSLRSLNPLGLAGTPTPSGLGSAGGLRPPGLGAGAGTRAGSVQGSAQTGRSGQVQIGPADVERGVEVLVRERLGRLERMIEETCGAIDNAFDPEQDPALAETKYANLVAYLQDTLTLVQRTGIGAIPLRTTADGAGTTLASSAPPSIQKLTQQITASAAGVFAAHRGVREGAGAVVNVLAKGAGSSSGTAGGSGVEQRS